MPIPVTCPKCHKRFRVSDKFAGQKGPCPNCKNEIQVPAKDEEVVVHAPEHSGPTDSVGRAVLEPIERTDAQFSVVTAVIAAVFAIVTLGVALAFRTEEGEAPDWLLIVGSFLVAIPVVKWGYAFLRDDEFEAYYGRELWTRTLICAAVYAILWGVYGYVVQGYIFNGTPLEIFHIAVVIPLMVAAGGFTGYAAFELEFLNGVFHYGMYLVVTVVLRLILNMPAF